jgi:thiamine-monophosphate kinase
VLNVDKRATSTGQLGGPALLSDVGEAGLLRAIQSRLSTGTPGPAVVGGGDDAAVWRIPPECDLVVSQDALVEGKDWADGWLTPAELGARALSVAVSDLAAMGAEPLYCLVTVCLRAATPASFVDGLLDGLCEAAASLHCHLTGGDLSAIDGPAVIDISVAGTCPRDTAMRRDAGRPGDLLLVTGSLGDAAAGLRRLQDGVQPRRARWHQSWVHPQARIKEGVRLRDAGVRCAGDISDGLLADAARTANACGCGAELWVDALPVDPPIRETFPDWLALATAGGEDFELLCALPPAQAEAVVNDWPGDLAPLHVVGRLTEGDGVSLLQTEGGEAVTAPAITSEHFRD